MIISYEKLWIQLKKNRMKKKDLVITANVTLYTMTKLNKGLPVSMETMVKFCKVFHCDIGDLMQLLKKNKTLRRKRYAEQRNSLCIGNPYTYRILIG